MEEVKFCSQCGAEWEPGSEQCAKCGHMLKRFRPTRHWPKVIRFDEAQPGYEEITIEGGMTDDN